jgi:hypothetical protein
VVRVKEQGFEDKDEEGSREEEEKMSVSQLGQASKKMQKPRKKNTCRSMKTSYKEKPHLKD